MQGRDAEPRALGRAVLGRMVFSWPVVRPLLPALAVVGPLGVAVVVGPVASMEASMEDSTVGAPVVGIVRGLESGAFVWTVAT